jgi:hypothetical protein
VASNGRGANQTALDSATDASYQLVDSSGAAVTHSYTYASSTNTTLMIAAFKHP